VCSGVLFLYAALALKLPTEITRNCKQHGSVAKPAGCMHIPVFWGLPYILYQLWKNLAYRTAPMLFYFLPKFTVLGASCHPFWRDHRFHFD